jgi:DNA-binding NarL/FixJ family response regulator
MESVVKAVRMFQILIVEDNPIFRQSLKEILKARFPDMVITEVSNGRDALKEIEGLIPDLIFMDIKLPGVSGLELTREITRCYSDMKIVILTSHDLPEYRDAAYESGASFFATKGLSSADEIAAMVQSCLPGLNSSANRYCANCEGR